MEKLNTIKNNITTRGDLQNAFKMYKKLATGWAWLYINTATPQELKSIVKAFNDYTSEQVRYLKRDYVVSEYTEAEEKNAIFEELVEQVKIIKICLYILLLLHEDKSEVFAFNLAMFLYNLTGDTLHDLTKENLKKHIEKSIL